jgi:predicted AAA+ superfamily ATPase
VNINRSIYSTLTDWANKPHRKPLLLRGARQVGKSFAIRHWGHATYGRDNLLEINLEERPDLGVIFKQNLLIERIEQEIFLATGFDLSRPGVALFIDEIQSVPEAITALRYFYEKHPSLPVIAAGSLLEFALGEVGLPVGRIESLYLYPLSFAEFLSALGKEHLAAFIRNTSLTNAIPSHLHEELLTLLKRYFFVGGMPEAVNEYSRTNNLASASRVHLQILSSFKDDFAKYAHAADWEALRVVFDRSPYHIAETGIKLSRFDPSLKAEKVRRALHLLSTARVLTKVRATSKAQFPLRASAEETRYKLVFIDIGLAQAALGFDWRQIPVDADLTTIFDGKFAEQFVGQEILATRSAEYEYQLHYWHRDAPGSSAEVDYLLERGNSIIPIEVKSGHRGHLKSLAVYQTTFRPESALILSQRNIESLDNLRWVPLYLAGRV